MSRPYLRPSTDGSSLNMNNINPFGNSILPTDTTPVAESPIQSSPFEGLSQLIGTRPQMNQGIGSFKTLLSPILQNIERQNKMEFVEKIDPYIQQVEQLTQQTFPNIDFSMSNGFGGFGGSPAVDFMTPNMGGENQLGVPVGNALHDLRTALPTERSGSIDTPFARSILSNGLGSLFK